MRSLAPIGVCTYSRLDHLRQTIEALKANTLAKDSELYVFSDAPKPGDEGRVGAVRQYLRGIDGFREIHILERKTNGRVANARGGIEEVLRKHGRIIFLEDDVVTAPGFLQFMNDALEFYKDDARIGSISAYCPPMKIPQRYKKDIFALTRFNPWGVALWSRYYRMNAPIPRAEFERIFSNKALRDRLARSVGEEALPNIQLDVEGKLDAGDMKSMFWQFCENKLTIYPRRSLSRSIGQDGSGYHMGVTDKWDVSEMWDKSGGFEFCPGIGVDEEVRKRHFKFYKTNTFRRKVGRLLRRIGIYEFVRPALDRMQSVFR